MREAMEECFAFIPPASSGMPDTAPPVATLPESDASTPSCRVVQLVGRAIYRIGVDSPPSAKSHESSSKTTKPIMVESPGAACDAVPALPDETTARKLGTKLLHAIGGYSGLSILLGQRETVASRCGAPLPLAVLVSAFVSQHEGGASSSLPGVE